MDNSRKKILFSIDQFIILIAWLGALFAILYFKAYELVIPSIVAFIILNLAIGLWVNRFIFPIQNKSYRKYLTIQTLFLLVWCPPLALILSMDRTDLLPLWTVILVAFYIGLGVVSGMRILKNSNEQKK